MKTTIFPKVLLVAVVGVIVTRGTASASPTEFIFTNRANVNLMNSWMVSVTATYVAAVNGYNANQLRGSLDGTEGQSGIAWFSGYFPNTQKETFTINFGTTRNLKTIRTDGASNFDSATIETSPDGVAWTTRSHTLVSSGNERKFILDSAVDAQYLRITGESYVYDTGGLRRVALEDLRVYGDVGTLRADAGLDLISRSAGGGFATNQVGGGITTIATLAEQSDDNPATFPSRQLLYNMGSGDYVNIALPELLQLERFGFKFSDDAPGAATTADTNLTFQLYGSTNGGVSFPILLLERSGGLTRDLNFFGLPNVPVNALRFTIVSSTIGDNRFTDFFAFIPEPSTATLLAGAALVIGLHRMRRR